jgi:hypothetical protein
MEGERTSDALDEPGALLAVHESPALSLDPRRAHARPLRALAPDRDLPADVRLAIARGIVAIAAAVRRSFPENLYLDLDLPSAVLARGGRAHGRAWVEETAAAIGELHDLFGEATSIRFRYVHDFLYGFDWARWVARDPAARAGIGPFDRAFLEHARRRGHELLALIEEDDEKYRRLPASAHRNPFPFARDPDSEARLLRDLASRGWIPVEAWDPDARPVWDRAYSRERERTAFALGIEARG